MCRARWAESGIGLGATIIFGLSVTDEVGLWDILLYSKLVLFQNSVAFILLQTAVGG